MAEPFTFRGGSYVLQYRLTEVDLLVLLGDIRYLIP